MGKYLEEGETIAVSDAGSVKEGLKYIVFF